MSYRENYLNKPETFSSLSQSLPNNTISNSENNLVDVSKQISNLEKLSLLIGTKNDDKELRKKIEMQLLDLTNSIKSWVKKSKLDIAQLKNNGNVSLIEKGKLEKVHRDLLRLEEKHKSLCKTVSDKLKQHVIQLKKKELEIYENSDEMNFNFFQNNSYDVLHDYQQQQQFLQDTKELQILDYKIQENEEIIFERDRDIQEIEHQIIEVNDIFISLANIISEQAPLLDSVERNVENVLDNVQSSNTELLTATKTQKKSRNLKCWILLFCLFALVILVVLLQI